MDGNLDIVVGNSREANTVFLNRADATVWERIQLSDKKFNTYDIITSDLNGDGREDIIESNSDEVNYYYFNQLKVVRR